MSHLKIAVSAIDPNPHRDLKLNPVSDEQAQKIVESIGRTGFWDNIVVRKHPKKEGRYQLAYGHTRLRALKLAKVAEVNLPVLPLSDWEMYECMVDENATQKDRTTAAAYEDVKVGLHLVEQYLRQCKTVEEFNRTVKVSVPRGTDSAQEARRFEEARANVLAGESIGRRFVEKVLPTSVSKTTIQSVLHTEYGQKIAAAKEAEAEAKEAEARAANSKAEASRLRDEAATLRQEAEKAGDGFIATELMLQFGSPRVMSEFAAIARSLGIPKEKHAAAVAWATDNNVNPKAPLSLHAMRNEMSVWWLKASGKAEAHRKEARKAAKAWKMKDKTLDDFASDVVHQSKDWLKKINALQGFAGMIENKRLRAALAKAMLDIELAANAVGAEVQGDTGALSPAHTALPAPRH